MNIFIYLKLINKQAKVTEATYHLRPPLRATTFASLCKFVVDDEIDESIFDNLVTPITNVLQQPSERDIYYDLTGRPLNGEPTKRGMYIVNGKKRVC